MQPDAVVVGAGAVQRPGERELVGVAEVVGGEARVLFTIFQFLLSSLLEAGKSFSTLFGAVLLYIPLPKLFHPCAVVGVSTYFADGV